MAHVDTHDEDWEKDAPLLASLKGEQPYDAPEGYFESFPTTMMDRIRALDGADPEGEPAADAEVVAPGRSWRIGPRTYGIAAGIAVLVALGLYFLVRSIDVPIEQVAAEQPVGEAPAEEMFDEDELMSQIDLSLISDDEIVEMMGDEALAAWEVDQLGQDLSLDELDLGEVELEDLEGLDDLDLEGIEDLLY